MIIKCVSRKSNVDQLIRYVLAETKTTHVKQPSRWDWYTPGVKLTDRDTTHLNAELADATLAEELRTFNGPLEDFIKTQIAIEKEKNLQYVVIKNNMRARSIKGYIREFDANEKLRLHRRTDSVQAYHHIISFSQKDSEHLNQKILTDIARQYIALHPNNLFIGAIHSDKEHQHIHLVQSGLQYCTGLASRISRQEFQELKVSMQEYQLKHYPLLIHSLPNFNSKNIKEERMEIIKNIKTHEREQDKKVLVEFLTTTFNWPVSKQEFLDKVIEAGHEVYIRNGQPQGIKFEGNTKFRFSTLGFSDQVAKLDTSIQISEQTTQKDIERYARTKESEQLVMKVNALKFGTEYEMAKKEFEQGREKDIELNELRALEELRGKSRIRPNEKKQEKADLYEDQIRGKTNEEIRDIQQEILNRNLEFEEEQGITRNTTQTQDISGINLYNTYVDRLCNDCQRESQDPTYEHPKYYTGGIFDPEKYQAHLSEELGNVIDSRLVNEMNSDNYTKSDESWGSFSDDNQDKDLRDLDDLRDDDLTEDRERIEDDNWDRDDDDYDLER